MNHWLGLDRRMIVQMLGHVRTTAGTALCRLFSHSWLADRWCCVGVGSCSIALSAAHMQGTHAPADVPIAVAKCAVFHCLCITKRMASPHR